LAKRTAVIDIGSNSARMVIYEKTSRFAFHLIHETKSRVRISENAYENDNNLQDEALERAYNALQEFILTLQYYKVRKVLCVATSALRDAPNRQAFIQRVKQGLQLSIKIIDGNKEAYYGGIAAANLLYLDTGLTIDIGGGSTELALYENKEVTFTVSLNLGTVRLKELYFDNGDIDGAKEHILNEFKKLPSNLKHENIIGIGGTLRALSKMILEKEKVAYQKLHGFTYKIQKQASYFHDILNADEKDLKQLGVKKDRLDVIQPGLLILTQLIEYINAKKVITSGVGVREGLYLNDILRSQQHKFPTNYNPSVRSLLDRFSQNENTQINKYSGVLFDICVNALKLNTKHKLLFLYAVKLSQIGKELDFYEAHRHAYYLLLNGLNYAFSHKDTMLISTLVRYQRKKSPALSHLQKYKDYLPNTEVVNALSFLMSLTLTLFNDFSPGKECKIYFEGKDLCIQIQHKHLLEEKLKDITTGNSYFNIRLV